MSERGYIKLSRRILNNMLWLDKPFDYAHAWVDLLLLANYKDHDVIRKGRVVHRKRGEVDTSIGYLSDRWGWSKNKVRRFLSILHETSMCTVKGTPDGTTLRVENYSKYQDWWHTNGTPDGSSDETPDGTHDNKGLIRDKERVNKSAHARGKSLSSFLEDLEAIAVAEEEDEEDDEEGNG